MKPLSEIIAELFEGGWCNPTAFPIWVWIVVVVLGIVAWKSLDWLATSR